MTNTGNTQDLTTVKSHRAVVQSAEQDGGLRRAAEGGPGIDLDEGFHCTLKTRDAATRKPHSHDTNNIFDT